MAAFRKVHLLAVLLLLLGFAGQASAQVTTLTCTAAAAVPPLLRQEGLTELVGDIIIDCTGGVPTAAGAPVQLANFNVFLNTNVTSRTFGSGGSEAILIVDEPLSASNPLTPQFFCGSVTGCPVTGTGTGVGTYAGTVDRPNIFRGTVVNPNGVQWVGVPIDPPGTIAHRIFRITNIRANANGIAAAGDVPGQIQASIAISTSQSLALSDPVQTVGFVRQGLDFTVRNQANDGSAGTSDIAFPQCNSLSRTTSSGSNAFVVRFTERFPTAFKVQSSSPGNQNIPGVFYNTESGFYQFGGFAGAPNAALGLADSGTRLKAVFSNIPAGVNVFVQTTNIGANVDRSAFLVTGEAGAVAPALPTFTDFRAGTTGITGLSGTQIPVVNGTATAVWEVNGASTLIADNYQFWVWFSFSANAAQNSPPPGTGQVTGSFAPTPSGLGVSDSTARTASGSLHIPRFAEGTVTRNIITVFVRRTNLLFPFVTNQAGFDTGLAIANTSLDTNVFNTPVQTGACDLFPFGAGAGATVNTGAIAGGATYVTTASTSFAGFQGYIIARCAFQFAHGFAFISDFGARNLAMGYLALVIPDPAPGAGRPANPFPGAGAGTGEQLGF
jgi:hypothetical protein